jgi:hypothetical protein
MFADVQGIFHDPPVTRPMVAAHPNSADWGLNLSGIQLPVMRNTINISMSTVFGDLLAMLGMRFVTTLHDFLVVNDSGNRGNEYMPSRSPRDMIFSAIPAVDKVPSSRANRLGQPEFHVVSGRQEINDDFWRNQIAFYTRVDGRIMRLMEVAAFIPSWCLHEDQRADQEDAARWFQSSNCGIGNDFVMMSLFDHYAFTFLNIMGSPMVKIARKFGFRPLFLLRNCLLQRTRFGVHNHQFSSCDKGAKSTLILLGFWRMRNNDGNDVEVIGLQANGSYLTHYWR